MELGILLDLPWVTVQQVISATTAQTLVRYLRTLLSLGRYTTRPCSKRTSIRGLALSFANLLVRQLLPRLHGVRIQHVLEREQERRRDDALRDLRSNTCATSVPHNTK